MAARALTHGYRGGSRGGTELSLRPGVDAEEQLGQVNVSACTLGLELLPQKREAALLFRTPGSVVDRIPLRHGPVGATHGRQRTEEHRLRSLLVPARGAPTVSRRRPEAPPPSLALSRKMDASEGGNVASPLDDACEGIM